MSKISIVNGKTDGWIGTHYIGRSMRGQYACSGSALANPFKAQNKTATEHDRVVQLYKTWLAERVAVGDKKVCSELQQLLDMYKLGEDLVLSCWCKPLPCHGAAIKQVLEQAELTDTDFC